MCLLELLLADNDAPAWRHTALELSHRVHLLQCELRDAAEAAERLQANADLMYVALSEEEEVTRRRADEVRIGCIPVLCPERACSFISFVFCIPQATQLASATVAANSVLTGELAAARSEIVRLREELLLVGGGGGTDRATLHNGRLAHALESEFRHHQHHMAVFGDEPHASLAAACAVESTGGDLRAALPNLAYNSNAASSSNSPTPLLKKTLDASPSAAARATAPSVQDHAAAVAAAEAAAAATAADAALIADLRAQLDKARVAAAACAAEHAKALAALHADVRAANVRCDEARAAVDAQVCMCVCGHFFSLSNLACLDLLCFNCLICGCLSNFFSGGRIWRVLDRRGAAC